MLRLIKYVIVLFASLPLAHASDSKILVLGDSLSSGYGLRQGAGWVWLLDERLERAGYAYEVVNASISGDTTAGGLTRLGPLLERHHPDIVILELGANDGLRGFGFDLIAANLARLVRRAEEAGATVLLLGLRLPPNYGPEYTDGFQAIFAGVAAAEGVPLVEQMLDGVSEDWALMQADGLHPTAEAQTRILDNIWPQLEALLSPIEQ